MINRAPMAQLVEQRVVTREVVSSTPVGPTLRVLKYLRNKCYLCNYISKWLEFKSSRIRTINRRPRLTVPSVFKLSTWDVIEPPHHSKRVRREVPGVVAVLLSSKCCRFGRCTRCMTPRTQKQPQVEEELCRVLDNVK